jgi:hypothetical protein
MRGVRWFVLFLLSAWVFCIPSSVFAISAPSVVDLFVAQGERGSVEISVWNDATTGETFSFSFVHVSFDEDGAPVLGAAAHDVPWLGLAQSQQYFSAGETRPISVTVAPGEDVSSGSYVFALLATSSQGDGYVFTHGTATLMFITVGSVQARATCVAFSLEDDGTFSLTLDNDGQGILYDEGEIILRGPFGVPFGSTPSNPSGHRIFAGQTRTWSSESLSVPWWAFGPVEYSFESEFISPSCSRIPAGFGWLPIIGIVTGVVGILVIRRRA